MLFAQLGNLTEREIQGAVVTVALFIVLAFVAWMLFILFTCFQRIPKVYREIEPWQVWLILIPCAGYLFGFFIFPNLAKSYQNYFNEHRRADVGDCGRHLSWWVAWTFLLVFLPMLQLCALPVPELSIVLLPLFLALLVVFVVQAVQLKKLIPEDAAEIEPPKHSAVRKKAAKEVQLDNPLTGEIDLDLDSVSSALGPASAPSPAPLPAPPSAPPPAPPSDPSAARPSSPSSPEPESEEPADSDDSPDEERH